MRDDVLVARIDDGRSAFSVQSCRQPRYLEYLMLGQASETGGFASPPCDGFAHESVSVEPLAEGLANCLDTQTYAIGDVVNHVSRRWQPA
jgi:hypothetical protein